MENMRGTEDTQNVQNAQNSQNPQNKKEPILNELETLNENNSIVNQPKLMGVIDRILIKRSIARRVSDVQPLKGPVGIITGAQWDKTQGKLTLAKEDIQAVTRKIRTEFTREALQDLQGIYKESFYDVLAHYLVDEMAYEIDADFISMIKARASTKNSLVFTEANHGKRLSAIAQSISITVNKGLADLPISDNRSPLGWAVVSSNVASLLGGTVNNTTASDNLDDDSPSYFGKIAGVDYYIDYTHPNDGVDSVVFGIKGNGISRGSTIYSHYTRQWIETISPETGEMICFLLDRTGMDINPLDTKYYNGGIGTSAFLGKFNVDIANLQIFR